MNKKNCSFFSAISLIFIVFVMASCQQTAQPEKEKVADNELTAKQIEKKASVAKKMSRFDTITLKQLKKVAKKTPKDGLINFGDLFVEIGNYERAKVCFDEVLKRDLLSVERNHTVAQLEKCEQYLKQNIKVVKAVDVPTLDWWKSLPIEWQELLNETAVSSNPSQADIDKLFYDVNYLNFKNTAISSLEPIAPLVNLTSINADYSALVSLYGVVELKKLQSIRATKTKIVSFSGIEKLTNLRELRAAYNDISSLKPLENLPHLTHLDIRGTKVTDLSPISRLSSLEQLLFSGLQVSTLENIKSLTGLETVFCDQTKIDTLGYLAGMKSLKSLNITKTNVRSLAALDGLNKLEKLYCMNTPLSKKEINRFKKTHPNCIVYSNFDKPK